MQAHCIKGLGFPTAGSAGRVREDQTASRREPVTHGKVNSGSERSKLRNANFGGTHHRSEGMYALRSSVREAPPRGSANQRPITIAHGPHCRRAGFARDPPPWPAPRNQTSSLRRRTPVAEHLPEVGLRPAAAAGRLQAGDPVPGRHVAEREKRGTKQTALSVITAIDRGNRIPARVQDLAITNHEEVRSAAVIHLAVPELRKHLPLQVQPADHSSCRWSVPSGA